MIMKTVSHGRVVSMERKNVLNLTKKQRLTLADMLKSVTKDNLHSEMDWGVPRGSEVW
jgi:antitoxin component of MazEF toxin-antitoxin module